jgi:hypothetical protein
MHSSNGAGTQPEDGALNSLSVRSLFSGDDEPRINTDQSQKNSTVEAKNGSVQVAADLETVNPGEYIKHESKEEAADTSTVKDYSQ